MKIEYKRMSREEWDKLSPQQKKEEMYLFENAKNDYTKFRKRLLIASRILALFLIIGIFWVGFVQFTYKTNITKIYDEYGPQANCYLCGLQNLKTCGCTYYPAALSASGQKPNITAIAHNLAIANIAQCSNIDLSKNKEIPLNISN